MNDNNQTGNTGAGLSQRHTSRIAAAFGALALSAWAALAPVVTAQRAEKPAPGSAVPGMPVSTRPGPPQDGVIRLPVIPLTEQQKQSVITINPDVLRNSNADFSLRHTIANIVRRNPQDVVSDTRVRAFLRTMLDSYAQPGFQSISGIFMPVSPNPGMVGRDAAQMLDENDRDGMLPIGITVHSDAANPDPNSRFSSCGEYRITYSAPETDPSRRALFIFEASMTNAFPPRGLDGCIPLFRHLAELEQLSSRDALAIRLNELTYNGITLIDNLTGQTFFQPPVISAAAFMNPGQIRANTFTHDDRNSVEIPGSTNAWHLQQFSVAIDANGTVFPFRVPVANTPYPELFKAPVTGEPVNLTQAKLAFQDHYKGVVIPGVMGPERRATRPLAQLQDYLTDRELINTLGSVLICLPMHCAFEAKSTFGGLDQISDPMPLESLSLRADVDQIITNLNAAAQLKVQFEEVRARVQAQSCGGCHNQSNFRPIAAAASISGAVPILWTPSLVFVQFQEPRDGRLPASTSEFLDQAVLWRREILYKIAFPFPSNPPPPGTEVAIRGTATAQDFAAASNRRVIGWFLPDPAEQFQRSARRHGHEGGHAPKRVRSVKEALRQWYERATDLSSETSAIGRPLGLH